MPPAPRATLLPLTATTPVSANQAMVSVKPLMSRRPLLPLIEMREVSMIWLEARSCTKSLFAPPAPSPMVMCPPMAWTPSFLFSWRPPAFTVVVPLKVFAVVVPERSWTPVPFLIRLPFTPVMAPEKVRLTLSAPKVSVPLPRATLLPLTATAPVSAKPAMVSLKLFRSRLPLLPWMSTNEESMIWFEASSLTMSAFAPPAPSPMVRLPPTAVTPAVLFRSSSPAFTVVRPV